MSEDAPSMFAFAIYAGIGYAVYRLAGLIGDSDLQTLITAWYSVGGWFMMETYMGWYDRLFRKKGRPDEDGPD